MPPTADDVTRAVLEEAGIELDECITKIRHCLGQLTDEQVWWRPTESMNSIGNLILHLTGNVRQWMVSGLGGEADHRDRPAEFAQRDPIPKAMLIAPLEQVVRETKEVFSRLGSEQMLAERTIQGFKVTGWNALFHCVPHFKGHTQEIISFTRMQLQDRYRFHWQPENAAQGAPATS
jgi:uncharacterized damage-inducible protein DinB